MGRGALRAGWLQIALIVLFSANVGVVGFSLVGSWALASSPNVPDWDYERLSSVLAILNITTAFAVAALHMGAFCGPRNAALLLVLCVLLAGGAEWLGTTTGFPFGTYEYTRKLGPLLLGRVPFAIPLAWFTMVYASLAVARGLVAGRWVVPIIAGAAVALWDIALDPAMTAQFPAWVWAGSGGLYGIPLQNWVAWFAVAWLVSLLYTVASPDAGTPPSRLPWALYTVQSVFAAVLATVYGRGWATAVWAIGFAGLVGLRWRLARVELNSKRVEQT